MFRIVFESDEAPTALSAHRVHSGPHTHKQAVPARPLHSSPSSVRDCRCRGWNVNYIASKDRFPDGSDESDIAPRISLSQVEGLMDGIPHPALLNDTEPFLS
ncbi:hypothetical protein E2C01_031987 [Portunus trituberculatus]|uniref:Uncharacterized protein n=1 Tax=Portunus trituberculatus TaxID=210409 RepID=A0A5B7EU86_PORTR|nr:hypothetical protein [Portunus trituberculatus]